MARAAKEENVRMAGLKEHIFLIGFMGCGKSTNAARLAEMTGAEQVEMDQEIVNGEQTKLKMKLSVQAVRNLLVKAI